jgi:predicted ATP-grasp superfamily ATP-dependent carboligase
MLLPDHFLNKLSHLGPMLIFALAANAIKCLALLIATISLFRSHRAQREQVEALRTLLLRNIQPEELIKFKSALERLSETELENLLASRDCPPETGSSDMRRQ